MLDTDQAENSGKRHGDPVAFRRDDRLGFCCDCHSIGDPLARRLRFDLQKQAVRRPDNLRTVRKHKVSKHDGHTVRMDRLMADGGEPIRVPKTFRIIAHRGASGYAPENTMEAFELAARMGAAEIEYDLQYSRDHRIVVVHDTVLDRYGYPGLHVSELTLSELKALDMGAWFDTCFAGARIVTLDELLERFGGAFVHHAEIKAPAPGLVEGALNAIDAYGVSDRVVITSFAFEPLVEVLALRPAARVGWLVAAGGFNAENVRRAAGAGFFQICPSACDTGLREVASAKARVAEVRAHGIRTRADLRQAVDAGCDGVTLNWPDWAVHE